MLHTDDANFWQFLFQTSARRHIMVTEIEKEDFEAELITSFTIDEVEQRLEMALYCCQGGNFGIGNDGTTCCGW
jgi:hypothetical protein